MSSETPSVFSSEREKRLWKWSLAVVVAIYSTLVFASSLSEFLYHQAFSAVAFLGCMILVGCTVLTQGLKSRPKGVEIGIGLGIAVVYFMVFFRLAIPERSHLIEYSVLATFVFESFSERASQGRRVRFSSALTVLGTSLIGAIDEFIQVFLPHRVFDWTDILFNFLAALMTVVALTLLGWTRRLVTGK